MWKKLAIILAVLVVLVTVGLWRLAAMFEPEPELDVTADPATLRTVAQGRLVGFADVENTYSWRGIPYARAPVGALRWRAPQLPTELSGTFEALRFGPMCPQVGSMVNKAPRRDYGKVVGSEDCLTLNVWTPRFAAEAIPRGKQRLPVMVWIHGGANINGGSSIYPFVRNLAGQQQVVMVSINYRLGVLGWFHHPALDTETSTANDRSGNYGTLDIIQALHWVRENISAFGGDPQRVTIFGESAGGFNVYAMLLSPQARGLFQGAISQSGSSRTVPLSYTENYSDDVLAGHEGSAREIVNTLLVRDSRAANRDAAKALQERMAPLEIREYLYAKSAVELIAAVTVEGNKVVVTPSIFRDGTVIPDADPLELFADPARYNAVPFIAGTNRDEMRAMNVADPEYVDMRFGLFPSVRDRALFDRAGRYGSDNWIAGGTDEPLTAMNASGRQDVFGYRFDWDELPDLYVLDLGELAGAGHGSEVNFVFNVLDNRGMVGSFYDKKSLPGRTQLAHAMSSYWAQFAHTAGPGRGRAGDLPQWEPWRNDGEKYMIFDSEDGGGLHMGNIAVSSQSLQKRLLADYEQGVIPNHQELCRWFAELFLYMHVRSDGHTREDYERFGPEGCASYPPEQFRIFRTF